LPRATVADRLGRTPMRADAFTVLPEAFVKSRLLAARS
jgi:hypothetical protein